MTESRYWRNQEEQRRQEPKANQSFVAGLKNSRLSDTQSLRQSIKEGGIAVSNVIDDLVPQSRKLSYLAELVKNGPKGYGGRGL